MIRTHIRAAMDYPGVRCAVCSEEFEEEGTEPACWDEGCPVLIDRLPDEALRALGIRNMMLSVVDMGLSQLVIDNYGVSASDLDLLTFIAREEAELRREIEERERQKQER